MVWKCVLGDSVSMKVIIPDMGHGNCIGVFEDTSGSLLVDCGAQNDDKKANFDAIIRGELEGERRRDLIITHYHADHHNLLQTFNYKTLAVVVNDDCPVIFSA